MRDFHPLSSVMWLLQFAPPSSGKSIVHGRLIQPFEEFQLRCATPFIDEKIISSAISKQKINAIKDIDLSKDGAIEACRSKLEGLDLNLKMATAPSPSILLSMTSLRGLLERWNEQGGTQILLDAEAESIEKILNEKDNIDILLKSYGQESIIYKVHNVNINIPKPALYINGFTQYLYASKLYLSKKFLAKGVLGRFTPIIHTGNIENLYKLVGNEDKIYNNLITAILNEFFTQDKLSYPSPLEIDDDAYKLYMEYDSDIKGTRSDGDAALYASRLAEKAVSLSVGIHLIVNPPNLWSAPINFREMQQSIYLIDNTKQYAFHLLDENRFAAEQDAKKIIKHFQRMATVPERDQFINTPITSTDIQRKVNLRKPQVDRALQLLVDTFWFASCERSNGPIQVLPNPNFFVNILR